MATVNVNKPQLVQPYYKNGSPNITAAIIDTITLPGVYYAYFAGGSVPVGGWGILIVANLSNSALDQVAITTTISRRHYESGSWGSWKSVALT